MKISLYTLIALIAFAGNSVLCRLALGDSTIDAASFTWIRLVSGVAVLVLILTLTSKHQKQTSRGSWWSALMLFIYALSFSYAYISLQTGMGALILFGAVQITMITAGLWSGNR